MNTLLRSILFLGLLLIINGCSIFSGEEKSPELKLLWEYSYNNPNGYGPYTLPQLVQENAILTSGDRSITLLEIETGNLLWKTFFNEIEPLKAHNFGVTSEIITGVANRGFYAWNKKNGNLLWKLNIPDSISWNHRHPLIASNDNLFMMSGAGSDLYFIDSDGNVEFQETTYTYGVPVLSGDTLYLGQEKNLDNGIFRAFDSKSMNLLWQFEDDKLGLIRIPPIVENGIVYLFTSVGGFRKGHNTIFSLNAKTGAEIWRYEDLSSNSTIVTEDHIYGVSPVFVWALDKNDGTLLWRIHDFSAGNPEGNLAFWDGYLYCPFSKGLLIIDAENGDRIHQVEPLDAADYRLVVAGKGRIFAQSSHKLHAFAPWGHEEPLEE